MEHFFDYYHSQPVFSWVEELVPAKQSAFVTYTQHHKLNEAPAAFVSKNINIKKRMREFLIKSSTTTNQEIYDYSKRERSRRHMMSERMRREKQKHSYMRLHSLLPPGTKKDRHSIIIKAAEKVEELKKCREELERQKSEMNKMLGARESSGEGVEMEEAKIRINVAHPSSGVDSMLEVLKCLKQTSSNIRLIQSKFLPQQFSAVLGIQTKEIVSAGGKTVWGNPSDIGKVLEGSSFDVVLDNNGKDLDTVRYKIPVIAYETGTIQIMLEDREIRSIIGKRARDLLSRTLLIKHFQRHCKKWPEIIIQSSCALLKLTFRIISNSIGQQTCATVSNWRRTQPL